MLTEMQGRLTVFIIAFFWYTFDMIVFVVLGVRGNIRKNHIYLFLLNHVISEGQSAE